MLQCKGFIDPMIKLAEDDVVPLNALLGLPSMLSKGEREDGNARG